MKLGAFSLSLAVKDLQASKEFYQKLGYEIFHDQSAHNWLILKNGEHVIGLFQGMFENNIMTFNPGWDHNGQEVDEWTDVRELQSQLKARGLKLESEVDAASAGPGSFIVMDPDGNPIMFDQHR